jgi:hypothetical protein
VDTSFGSVRAPEQMGRGIVKITFSFPEWKTGKVVPATYEIPVEASK